MARILIAGCGYVGSALGEILVREAHDVWGVRRRAADLPLGVRAFTADLTAATSLRDLPGDLDAVLYMAAPAGSEDPHYRAAYVERAQYDDDKHDQGQAGLNKTLPALTESQQSHYGTDVLTVRLRPIESGRPGHEISVLNVYVIVTSAYPIPLLSVPVMTVTSGLSADVFGRPFVSVSAAALMPSRSAACSEP